jgi:hypothetical protein
MIGRWRNLWPYAQTWSGWIVAGISFFIAVYHGPKKLWETYEWYMERLFDSRVKEFLESHVRKDIGRGGQQLVWGTPKSVPEIAKATEMSEKRTLNCLRRLEKKKAVSREGNNWKISR